jgi:hypothetical protein
LLAVTGANRQSGSEANWLLAVCLNLRRERRLRRTANNQFASDPDWRLAPVTANNQFASDPDWRLAPVTANN